MSIISAVEYMNRINGIYNISCIVSGNEEAEEFTIALFSYFFNSNKNVYPESKDINWIRRVIRHISEYDCNRLYDSERIHRQTIAEHVANAYLNHYKDEIFCTVLIAFILRHNLDEVYDYIKYHAKKLCVKRILHQPGNNELLHPKRLFYYENKNDEKVLMALCASALFADDYDGYLDNGIKYIETLGIKADWYVVYFLNLDEVRVKRNGDVYVFFPDELLN